MTTGTATPARLISEKDLQGLKYFDRLLPLLERLHDDGCQRDKAGNRSLHFDQYCLLVLLYLFNPICSSLRAVHAGVGVAQGAEAARLRASGVGVVV